MIIGCPFTVIMMTMGIMPCSECVHLVILCDQCNCDHDDHEDFAMQSIAAAAQHKGKAEDYVC